MRRFVTFRTLVCLSLIGLFSVLVFAHSASARAPVNPDVDIRDYIVDKYGVGSATSTEIVLFSRDVWVKLRGPLTVSVLIDDNGSQTTQTVSIERGKTYMVGGLPASEIPWKATITLVINVPWNVALANLIFGASATEISQYLGQHMLPANRDVSEAAQVSASNAFTDVLTANGGYDGFPNMTQAAGVFGAIAYLAAAKDKDTGKALFPSLQSRAIRQVLTRMTLAGARSDKNLTAADTLATLLCGMDMTTANQSAPQSQ